VTLRDIVNRDWSCTVTLTLARNQRQACQVKSDRSQLIRTSLLSSSRYLGSILALIPIRRAHTTRIGRRPVSCMPLDSAPGPERAVAPFRKGAYQGAYTASHTCSSCVCMRRTARAHCTSANLGEHGVPWIDKNCPCFFLDRTTCVCVCVLLPCMLYPRRSVIYAICGNVLPAERWKLQASGEKNVSCSI
jgi:hypothetical protein